MINLSGACALGTRHERKKNKRKTQQNLEQDLIRIGIRLRLNCASKTWAHIDSAYVPLGVHTHWAGRAVRELMSGNSNGIIIKEVIKACNVPRVMK